jgi:hypothetical protein
MKERIPAKEKGRMVFNILGQKPHIFYLIF